ncbi:hypothetical protein ABPG77_010137 [Micractinium sp. CCAP 211/92]
MAAGLAKALVVVEAYCHAKWKPNTMAGVEEQSPLQLWQSEAAWGEFPNGIIVCPIEGEGLRHYYSMPRAAEEAGVSLGSWEEQLEEARQQQRQPLATKRKRKDGTCSQKGRGLTTIMAWQKTMEQLVGFAVKWLLLDAPSLTVVLVPQIWEASRAQLQAFKEAFKANKKAWTKELAKKGMMAGLCEVMCGRLGPVPRLGALRVTMNSSSLDQPCAWEDCKDPKCPKNHIRWYQNRKGEHATMECVHYKTFSTKGPLSIPMCHELLEVFAILEQAAVAYASLTGKEVHTLFWARDGSPFSDSYFSTICSQALSAVGGEWVTSNTLRHLFVTAFRSFTSSPVFKCVGLPATVLEEAASTMVMNTPTVWDSTYDENTKDRGMHAILSLWPQFVKFVHEQHLDKISEKALDPLTLDFTS